VCLTDLGLVTTTDPATSRELFADEVSGREGVAGTPAYMAPEQHSDDIVDARADQYAFCVSLWESVTGVRPFAGRDLTSLVHAKRHGPLRGRRARGVPRRLLRILARGLAPQPGRRWPSMAALLAELRRVRTSVQGRPRRLAVAASIAIAVGAAFVPTAPMWWPSSAPSGPPLALGSGPR
jgi:serine/threonine protein kinase